MSVSIRSTCYSISLTRSYGVVNWYCCCLRCCKLHSVSCLKLWSCKSGTKCLIEARILCIGSIVTMIYSELSRFVVCPLQCEFGDRSAQGQHEADQRYGGRIRLLLPVEPQPIRLSHHRV